MTVAASKSDVVVVKHQLGPPTYRSRYCSYTSNLPTDPCLGGSSVRRRSASCNRTRPRLAAQNRISHQHSRPPHCKSEHRKGISLTPTATSGTEFRSDGARVLAKRITVLQRNTIRSHSRSPRFDSGVPTGSSALSDIRTRGEVRHDIPIPIQAYTPLTLLAPTPPSSN